MPPPDAANDADVEGGTIDPVPGYSPNGAALSELDPLPVLGTADGAVP
ncbi:MAG: hypothetical protein M0Z46_15890 [Actinomycetota bacterium]|nr:hypothetical protein [Actinomycetota bacterium]